MGSATQSLSMPSAQLDLSEFENPRPGRSDGRSPPLIPSSPTHSSASLGDQQLHHDESLPNRSKRLKLPYRADVVLEGRRYKGRRVSRGEAGLEAETFELHDPVHVDNDRSASPESMSDDDCENSDAIQKLDEKRQDADRINAHRAERLKAEEQAVAARLAEAEKEEVARAHAVRKQKVRILQLFFRTMV